MLTAERQTDWSQKYRPQRLEDMILPPRIKTPLINIRDKQSGPSLFLHGRPGTGKTTVGKLLSPYGAYEINCSQRWLNVQQEIFVVCRTPPLHSPTRIVLLDEIDYLSESAQASLRTTIEQLSGENLFVATANYPKNVIPPLQSRLYPIDFSFDVGNLELRNEAETRIQQICTNEGANVPSSVITGLVRQHFPDMRKMLKQLQFEYGLM